jgi:hypothetical protein
MRAYLFHMVSMMLLTSSAVWAQSSSDESSSRVGVKTDWSVFQELDPKECWAVAEPKKTVNTKDKRVVSVKRSAILLMVVYKPAEKVTGQVVFTGGYTFAEGSFVDLNIDGVKFQLIPDGEWAWPEDSGADSKVVEAMKRGKSAVLSARSSRGTITKDTFSLLGFTAAVDDAAKRCTN